MPPDVNPYNFVKLEDRDERSESAGWDKIDSTSYSGKLRCKLVVLTPLFTADHQNAIPNSKIFQFLKNSTGIPLLQGTSIRGMVRAVYEAITNSCMPLAATVGQTKIGGKIVGHNYDELFKHKICGDMKALCPACRLFGVINGDTVHLRSRVAFSDALLKKGELNKGEVYLEVLSTPKPYHGEIYGLNKKMGGPIAGRKFYYHHGAGPKLASNKDEWKKQASAIAEYAPKGTEFEFDISFHGFEKSEFGDFLLAMSLEDGLAHKFGMGRPIGFGSCRIEVLQEKSSVYNGSERYNSYGKSKTAFDAATMTGGNSISEGLKEVLRFAKNDGVIGYRSYGEYGGIGIDEKGKYKQVNPSLVSSAASPPSGPKSSKPLTTIMSDKITEALKIGKGSKKDDSTRGGNVLKKGDKVTAYVIKAEEKRFVLSLNQGGGNEFIYEGIAPWTAGEKVSKLVVEKVVDGLIKKVRR